MLTKNTPKMVERVALAMWPNTGLTTPAWAIAKAAAYEAKLADAGLVVVPREPTEAMRAAGCLADNGRACAASGGHPDDACLRDNCTGRAWAAATYSAMMA